MHGLIVVCPVPPLGTGKTLLAETIAAVVRANFVRVRSTEVPSNPASHVYTTSLLLRVLCRVFDYLCDPLKDSMNDEDPYVRKTAVMCVAKLYEINQQRVEDYKFIDKLEEMISDGNGMVVSNAIAAIADIASVR